MTSKDFYNRSYPLRYFPILILEKEPVFPFSMLSAKQGNYWYQFYTLPLGYRGGGSMAIDIDLLIMWLILSFTQLMKLQGVYCNQQMVNWSDGEILSQTPPTVFKSSK